MTLVPDENYKISQSMIDYTVALVENLRDSPCGWTMKHIMKTFLTAEDDAGILKRARSYWGIPRGWPSTLTVLNAIKRLACKKREGKLLWKAYILAEAKKIVDAEASRHWRQRWYPANEPVRSLKPSFFNMDKSAERASKIQIGMGFLWKLIRHRLSAGRPATQLEASNVADTEDLQDIHNSDSDSLNDGDIIIQDESNTGAPEPLDPSGTVLPEPEQHEDHDSEASTESDSSSTKELETERINRGGAEDDVVVAAHLDQQELDEEVMACDFEDKSYGRSSSKLERLKSRFDTQSCNQWFPA
ncbi:uncharacterized protein MELLADRAFT_87407 [Melampsora larici-populina 98AG31]|uniref:Uncharacterized protein n=1 Tax=Melampsora larici-populina (strain 98AG31 / pathotype 3-4-7) TaxID=747676 RepID=F4RN73_MELLP|nr:uncharacterized protein MELLADRAFT_87407 [Melampsora larici-populina 98AG31]EGG06269.1 hypothetical protein MELLADRAFT_87407 [Melampsora larici-populina 98AG31]